MCLTFDEIEYLSQKLKTAKGESKKFIEVLFSLHEGMSEKEISIQFQIQKKTIERWRLVAQAGQVKQFEKYLKGRPKSVTPIYLSRLQQLIEFSPKDFGFAFTNWTAGSLATQLKSEFQIQLTARRINQILNQQGLSLRNKLDKHGQPSTTKTECGTDRLSQ